MILRLRSKRAIARPIEAVGNDEAAQADPTKVQGQVQTVLNTVDIANAAGRYGVSLRTLGVALLRDPENPELIFARATTLLMWGRHWEALWAFDSLRSRSWTHRLLPLRLGYTYLALGYFADAETWMRRAVEIDPDEIAAKDGLINAVMHQGRSSEAIAIWQRLFGTDDRDLGRLGWIVFCKSDTGDFSGAELDARRLLAIDANQPGVWVNLGIALNGLGRHEAALHAFREAMRLDDMLASDVDAFVNVGKQSMMLGQLDTCIETLEANLPHRPNIEGHLVYAEALLKSGRFAEGWRQYEFRWMRGAQVYLRHGPSRPVWSGQDLHGRTIFVRKEQGVGDTMQFIRYVPLLKQLGATVLLQKLPGIAMTFDGVDYVVEPEELPGYDYYINFLSLPRAFGTELDSIPCNIPYLRVDAERIHRWSKRIGGGDALRIGLTWAGSPVHSRDGDRSMPLQEMEPLLQLTGVRFFSLQKGAGQSQIEGLNARDKLDDLADEIADFADTAAIISRLDLVICVDTAVAHLAGALGKPVWLMAQKDGEWRWLGDDRVDSPWYPSMRIFRQLVHRDWREVVQRVKTALEGVVSGTTSLVSSSSARSGAAQPPRSIAAIGPTSMHTMPTLAMASEARAGVLQYFPTNSPESACLHWYGEFLQPQLDFIFQIIKPGATVIEVVPGIGTQSLQIANRLGPTGHLFLFESRPLIRRVLQQNLGVNAVRNVTVIPRAPGFRAVDIELGPTLPNALGDGTLTGLASLELLDDYLFEQLHLLKIGMEIDALKVLHGATETLWRLRPVLFVAVTEVQSINCIAGFIKAIGYRCWRMETPLFNPCNFNRRSDDIFSGRKAIALIAMPEEFEVDIDLNTCVEF
jgi:Flp pilus assembly protein TadD